MKKLCIALTVTVAALIPALSQKAGNPFAGRWDMTLTRGDVTFPSWLEVVDKDGTPEVRVQGRTGNVNPVAAAKMDGSSLVITVVRAARERPASEDRPAVPARPELTWRLKGKGDKFTGTQKQGRHEWRLTGVRAPALKREAPAAWSDPEPLFNGRDLTGWEPINNTPGLREDGAASHWVARNGELVNEAKGSNLRTTRTFDDFKLHVEYNCPPGENSGIYLRGRYEAQVTAPPTTPPPERAAARGGPGSGFPRNPFLGVGSIYGMVGPSAPPPFRPDWQTYDITLVGRWVTVVFNGVTTVDNQEIAGITGGAIDSNEAAPGPIYLQGDHHGGIRYRNITISVPTR